MWPWRKAEPAVTPSEPTTPELAVVRRPRADWQLVAPIQRVMTDAPLVNPVQRFSGSLAAWQDPSFLAPLAHALHADEPSGIIPDLATPAPSDSPHEQPHAPLPLASPSPATSARPAVQRRALGPPVALFGAPSQPVALVNPSSQPSPPSTESLTQMPGVAPLPVLTLPAVASASASGTRAMPAIQRAAPSAEPHAPQTTPLVGTAEAGAPPERVDAPVWTEAPRRLGLGEPIVGGVGLQRLSLPGDDAPLQRATDGALRDDAEQVSMPTAAEVEVSAPLISERPVDMSAAGTSTGHPAALPLVARDVVAALPALRLAGSTGAGSTGAGSNGGGSTGGGWPGGGRSGGGWSGSGGVASATVSRSTASGESGPTAGSLPVAHHASPGLARLIGDRPALIGDATGGSDSTPAGDAAPAAATPISWVDSTAGLRFDSPAGAARVIVTGAGTPSLNSAAGSPGGGARGTTAQRTAIAPGGSGSVSPTYASGPGSARSPDTATAPVESLVYAQRATSGVAGPAAASFPGVPISQLPTANASWVNPALQRAETGSTSPNVAVQREDAPAAVETAPTPPTPAPAAAGGGHDAGGDAEAMVGKLFDPLLSRLKTELRLDRERRGSLTDMWH